MLTKTILLLLTTMAAVTCTAANAQGCAAGTEDFECAAIKGCLWVPDEFNGGGSETGKQCAANQLPCGPQPDAECFSKGYLCDDYQDCNNNADEAACGHGDQGKCQPAVASPFTLTDDGFGPCCSSHVDGWHFERDWESNDGRPKPGEAWWFKNGNIPPVWRIPFANCLVNKTLLCSKVEHRGTLSGDKLSMDFSGEFRGDDVTAVRFSKPAPPQESFEVYVTVTAEQSDPTDGCDAWAFSKDGIHWYADPEYRTDCDNCTSTDNGCTGSMCAYDDSRKVRNTMLRPLIADLKEVRVPTGATHFAVSGCSSKIMSFAVSVAEVTASNPTPGPTTNPSPGPTTNPSPGPTGTPTDQPTTKKEGRVAKKAAKAAKKAAKKEKKEKKVAEKAAKKEKKEKKVAEKATKKEKKAKKEKGMKE